MKLKEYAKEITATFQVPGDDDGAEVTLRLLTPGEEDEAMEAATSVRFRAGDEEPETVLDSGRHSRLLFCKRIKSWKNIYGENGKPLPCTDENKLKVAGLVPGFARWVGECYRQLAESHQRKEIELEKNS